MAQADGRLADTRQSSEAADQARDIAAAALFAIIERRRFMKGGGFDPETPDQLVAELRTGRYKPGHPIGVSDYPVYRYWRQRSQNHADCS